VFRILFVILWAGAAVLHAPSSRADGAQIARGKYLVTLAGCNDCHTPGHFFGKPDATRELAGSDVGFEVPGVGVVAGPNLTPDHETGLGRWTAKQIATAIRSGVRPDGRVLSSVMPWPALAKLTQADTDAMVAYLQQLPPIKNKVPGPLRVGEPAPISTWKLMPPRKPSGG